ncbi:MAG: putative toxin-antitoxin system toxin component, PIN family [Oscillospiraceae bacterium]|nr:putative toxin-antitoxin system toxin component, PIN family [Oscillospiraceae bacterium]
MNIVLDTNVLVSAVWSPGRNAYNILSAAFARRFTLCYDHRILEEYERVLRYPKLGFTAQEVNAVLDPLLKNGLSVVADPIPEVPFERDETDRKFYEVAKFCCAVLISGNLAHYPPDPEILSPADFCRRYL